MKKEVLEKEGKELTKLNKESRNTITENIKQFNTSYNEIISKLKIVIKDFMAEHVKKIGSLEEMNSTIMENIALENVLLSNLKTETDPNSIQFHKEILEKEIHKIEESKKRMQTTSSDYEIKSKIIFPPLAKYSSEMKRIQIKTDRNNVRSELKRLGANVDKPLGERRFYKDLKKNPMPKAIQSFCDSFVGLEYLTFSSPSLQLEEIKFGQEFSLEEFEDFKYLKKDDILIGDGDYLIVANNEDNREDFDIFLVRDEESEPIGPFKVSEFLQTISLVEGWEEELYDDDDNDDIVEIQIAENPESNTPQITEPLQRSPLEIPTNLEISIPSTINEVQTGFKSQLEGNENSYKSLFQYFW
jgi:hypothetical protein